MATGPPTDEPYDAAPFGYLTTSPDGLVTLANRTLLGWLGRDLGEVRGRPLSDLLTPGAQMFFETQYRAVLHLRGRVDGVALDLCTADGRDFPVLITAEQSADVVRVSLFPAGSRAAYERELRRSRAAAQRSEALLRLLHEVGEACRAADRPDEVVTAVVQALSTHTRGGQVAVWLVDGGGRLVLEHGTPAAWTPAAVTAHEDLPITGPLRDGDVRAVGHEELRRRWPALAAPLATAGREALLLLPLVGDGAVLGVAQVALRRGAPLPPEEVSALTAVGTAAGAALLRCDPVTHLRGRPSVDALAGTATPAQLGEQVGGALARAAGTERPLALLLLDVTPGAFGVEPAGPVGAQALVELGHRLQRVDAGAVRVGAHLFAVLVEDCGPERARHYAERLQGALVPPGPAPGPVCVTVGGAVVEPAVDGRSVAVGDVLAWASGALHAATAQGPGRRVVHAAADRQAARALVHAERTLHRALEDDDVVLRYQPVVNLRTGRVVGVEALCRLRLPDGSLLLPAHFVDAAEGSGQLLPLGRKVLLSACRQRTEWASQGVQLDMAVNVSASQAARVGFAEDVRQVLAETACPAEHLILELTENVLLAATSDTLRSFEVLRGAGVRVALDDFGTRYASLDYVRSFPLDELKIDQSFVAGLPGSRVARAIVRMVAQLAEELDLACVAEGIETAAQAQFLRELDVLGQGFAVGRPVPPQEVVPWLTPAAWLSAAQPWDLEEEEPSARGG